MSRSKSKIAFAGFALLALILGAARWQTVDRTTPPKPAAQAAASLQHTATAAATPGETPAAPAAPALPAAPAATTFNTKESKRAYEPKSPIMGNALPATQAGPHNGPEKGRVMEVAKLTPEFLAGLAAGDSITLPVPDGEVRGVVNLVQPDEDGWIRVGGSLPDQEGSFTLNANGKESTGRLLLTQNGRAYIFETEPNGTVLLVERRLSTVRCTGKAQAPKKSLRFGSSPGTPRAIVPPPILSSRPSAPAVAYIDFDGETVTDPDWDGGRKIIAPAFDLTLEEMTEIFNRVSEDYAPFNIDITTDLNRYNAVPPNRRTRCIVTPNDTAAPGAGGVAYLNAFSQAGRSFSKTVPCWVFNSEVVGIAEAISHEVGHTVGLEHDGRISPLEEYFEGFGTGPTSWGPIMGAGYYVNVVQWSKGEYPSASNTEDDLALISRAENGFGYIEDETGGTSNTATVLNSPDGKIAQEGTIAKTGQEDFYAFRVVNGSINLKADPAPDSPNLDLFVQVINSVGEVVAEGDTHASLPTTAVATLPSGSYVVRVKGTGDRSVDVDGYSNYGSLGRYTLTGEVKGLVKYPFIISPSNAVGQLNKPFEYQIVATNDPTSYSLTGILPLGLKFNSTTGKISGIPTVLGERKVTIKAKNRFGSDSLDLTITISKFTTSLAVALELNSMQVNTGGNAIWESQRRVTHDHTDATVSGDITNREYSNMTVQVNGPIVVNYWWKVDCEPRYDTLSFLVDGVTKKTTSGVDDWRQVSVNIPAGAHVLEWKYQKDYSLSKGSDCGWVDRVTFTAP